MAKGKTNRDIVNHGVNGKGSKSRITDMRAYRENFEEINWGTPRPRDYIIPIIYRRTAIIQQPIDKPLKTLRELEEALNR